MLQPFAFFIGHYIVNFGDKRQESVKQHNIFVHQVFVGISAAGQLYHKRLVLGERALKMVGKCIDNPCNLFDAAIFHLLLVVYILSGIEVG